jgi:hypothetical protein
VKRQRRALSRTGDKTSEQEVQLKKPLKPSKKFVATGSGARSSGLSVGKKKASAALTTSDPSFAKKGGTIKAPSASAVNPATRPRTW